MAKADATNVYLLFIIDDYGEGDPAIDINYAYYIFIDKGKLWYYFIIKKQGKSLPQSMAEFTTKNKWSVLSTMESAKKLLVNILLDWKKQMK